MNITEYYEKMFELADQTGDPEWKETLTEFARYDIVHTTLNELLAAYSNLQTKQINEMEEVWKKRHEQLARLCDWRDEALKKTNQTEKVAIIQKKFQQLCDEHDEKWDAFERKYEQIHKAQRKQAMLEILDLLAPEKLADLKPEKRAYFAKKLKEYQKFYDEEQFDD